MKTCLIGVKKGLLELKDSSDFMMSNYLITNDDTMLRQIKCIYIVYRNKTFKKG